MPLTRTYPWSRAIFDLPALGAQLFGGLRRAVFFDHIRLPRRADATVVLADISEVPAVGLPGEPDIVRGFPQMPAADHDLRTLSSRKSGLPSVRAISTRVSGSRPASDPSNATRSCSAPSVGKGSSRSYV